MKFMASIKIRLFIISWIFFTIHFATNVVREYYPAFSLAEHGTFKVDEYQGFHPDIFVHKDGHSYIGNNVAASVIAAIPIFIFDPVLDMLEAYEKGKIQKEGQPETVYRTTRPNDKIFFDLVKKRGLSLRFGGVTAITSAFLMAPLSSLAVVFMFHILTVRGLSRIRAIELSLLFGFGTPVFFRTGVLNHNMFLMYTVFAAFYLLWLRPEEKPPLSVTRRFTAGFLCGFGLALDYSGLVPLLVFYGYLVLNRISSASFKESVKESFIFIIGAAPPVLFLLYSQWSMFGNPFLPGQYWMPDVVGAFTNPYSTKGFRGFTLPALDLYYLNLFSPSYGMYIYGPILVLGLVPACFYDPDRLILPRPERRLAAVFFFSFLTFCAANQYSRIQFNSGFRYLIPLVPLIYLAVCDHLVRIPGRLLTLLLIPVILNSWVISMVRIEIVSQCWNKFLKNGLQMPWLNVLRATTPGSNPVLNSPSAPLLIFSFTFLFIFVIWKNPYTRNQQIKEASSNEKRI